MLRPYLRWSIIRCYSYCRFVPRAS